LALSIPEGDPFAGEDRLDREDPRHEEMTMASARRNS
jgi:hypothetical protein